MKFAFSLTFAALLISGTALAQSYSSGERVEAFNSTTGKWETVTISRVDGGRYLLHSDNSAVLDWDVSSEDLRQPEAMPNLANDTAVPSSGASDYRSANGSVAVGPPTALGDVSGSASGNAYGASVYGRAAGQ